MAKRSTYKDPAIVTLDDFKGDYWLGGVDYIEFDSLEGVAQKCLFVLNGTTYCATEDPDDGYRSHLKDIAVLGSKKLQNKFTPPCLVRAQRISDAENNVVSFVDASTGVEVLRIGTHHHDD